MSRVIFWRVTGSTMPASISVATAPMVSRTSGAPRRMTASGGIGRVNLLSAQPKPRVTTTWSFFITASTPPGIPCSCMNRLTKVV